MSFLSDIHKLPTMQQLSTDARRAFVLAYVCSGGDVIVTARERRIREDDVRGLLSRTDIRQALIEVAYHYAVRLQEMVQQIERESG